VRKLVIWIADTGLGDPLAADPEGKPAELFVGSLAFQVTRMEAADERRVPERESRLTVSSAADPDFVPGFGPVPGSGFDAREGGQVMDEKTPGQIAFEAAARWQGRPQRYSRWENASPSDKARFDFIGQAVAEAVCPVPDPTGKDGE